MAANDTIQLAYGIPPSPAVTPTYRGGPLCHFVTSPHFMGSYPLDKGGFRAANGRPYDRLLGLNCRGRRLLYSVVT